MRYAKYPNLWRNALSVFALMAFLALLSCSSSKTDSSAPGSSTGMTATAADSENASEPMRSDSSETRTVVVEGKAGDKKLAELRHELQSLGKPMDRSAEMPNSDPGNSPAPNARPMAELARKRANYALGSGGGGRRQLDEVTRERISDDARAIATPRSLEAKEGELWGRLYNDEKQEVREVAFPLKHTDVKAQITGFIASTKVTQSYSNPFEEAIEAVYVFPLPQDSAVNGFEMVIGDRRIIGMVMRKAEARETYEKAKADGYTASLLEQNRPNIFTQSVANIAPKADVNIEISYFHRLVRKADQYEYHFPMVVGPRYEGHTPDIAAITPPAVPEGMRNGHNISLSVEVDAGVPISGLTTPAHETVISRMGEAQAVVSLARKDVLQNRDFVLRLNVIGANLGSGVMTHSGDAGNFASLMITPPSEYGVEDLAPREITFVMDVSGSMRGAPFDMCRNIVLKALEGMRPQDAFNIFYFASGNGQLFELPEMNRPENIDKAKEYLQNMKAGGGTEMLAGLQRLFASRRDPNRLRMVVFMTDGYVGNEEGILAEVKKNVDSSRFYAFGIGSSINRYLIEGIGKHGRGHAEVVLNREFDKADEIVQRFYSHINAPLLTDIELIWEGIEVEQQYPQRVNDLFSGHPVSVVAKLAGTGEGTVKIRGRRLGEVQEILVPFTVQAGDGRNSGLAPIWGRARIEELTDSRLGVDQDMHAKLTEEIVRTALAHNLVSEGTSFVAVDLQQKVSDGNPKKVDVPVEQPEGVDRKATRKD